MTPSRFVCRSTALLACFLTIVLAGCGSGTSSGGGGTASCGITCSSTPTASLSATALTFASTTVGQTAAAQTVTLTNTGTASLTITSIVLGGTNAADFTESSTCGASLAASASCTITAAFAPASAATFSATITVTDNASPTTQTIALTGTGTLAPVPQAIFNPTSLTFPGTTAGTTASALSATLTNNGTGPLAIGSIALGGANPSDFAQTNNCSSTLAANSSCTVSVTFTPAAASTSYTAVVTITDNANNVAGSTQTLALSGAGAPPVSTSAATFSPTSLTFSSNVGVTTSAQTTTLTNTGTAALAISSIAVTGGTTATSFAQTNNCPASLAVNASCTLSVTFDPASTGTYLAYVSVTDNATGSPQTVTLNGTGTAPAVTLSTTAISFPTTTVNATTSAYTATLTNSGTSALTISSVVLGGTNASNFKETNNCPTSPSTLAAAATCTISVTFTPTAAVSYAGAVTITDNVTGSPQTITLSGSGTTSTISYRLYELPDPGTGYGSGTMAALYSLVNNAQSTIDMTMYEMQDTTFLADLVAACNRGVKVRVIFSSSIASSSASAYSTLNATPNCTAKDSNSAFTNTHQKSFLVDGVTIALMSLNLQTQYYSTTRDYAMIYNDPTDLAAIETTFNQDWLYAGTNTPSELTYQAPAGDDLIWSPQSTTQSATTAMTNIIANAKSTLQIDAEEFSSSAIYTAVAAACARGVVVQATIENESNTYATGMNAVKSAGCDPHQYTSSTGFYMHAKAVVADYGLSTQQVYMGSINYSTASMTANRELGMYITDSAAVSLLHTAMATDFANAAAF